MGNLERKSKSVAYNLELEVTEISSLRPSVVSLPPLSEFKIRWHVLIPLLIMHIGAIAAFWFIDLKSILVAALLWLITGLFGITIGYHRLLTHQAFKMPTWLSRLHIFCGVLAFQLGPITWTRMHRAHHALSDRPEDPHPQIYGFWFGHIGWAFLAHPRIGRSAKFKENPPELMRDPFLLFCENFAPIIFLSSLGLLYLWGGLPMLLWAGFFRWVWVSHITWSVNSFGHWLGYRRFQTSELSANNPVVALLAWGEGWHNNHHRFPSSAQQGLAWYEFDASWMWIRFLQKLGLAWEVKTPAIYAPPPVGPAD